MKLPFISAFLIAQLPIAPDPWWTPLANFGIAGIVIGWFMYRDKRDSDKQDTRHRENLDQQRKIENAFRLNTTSIIVALSALKVKDQQVESLIQNLKEAHENPDR